MARYNENNLTIKQQIFADEWLLDGNGLRAYRKAFSKKCSDASAMAEASKTLRKPYVDLYIRKRQGELAESANVSQERVVLEERRIAFADIGGLFNKDGEILSPNQLPENLARAVAAVEVTKKPNGDTTYKYRFFDKGAALGRLEKILGMYEADNRQKGITFEQLIKAFRCVDPALADLVLREVAKIVQN